MRVVKPIPKRSSNSGSGRGSNGPPGGGSSSSDRGNLESDAFENMARKWGHTDGWDEYVVKERLRHGSDEQLQKIADANQSDLEPLMQDGSLMVGKYHLLWYHPTNSGEQ